MPLARKHADVADEMLRELFATTCVGEAQSSLLLGAVGGYGRRLLALGSDLDLCFVVKERSNENSATIESFMYPLWDAGISVGHQVLCPADVVEDARADLKMATELLDFRPLAGEVAFVQSVRQRLAESIFSPARVPAFIGDLESHARERHQRYGDTVYLLEPDVKNGTGGLRDLDFALWAARARFGTSDLDELVRCSVLDAHEKEDTERALDFLWAIRNHLHHLHGRKTDRLTFAEQESVALAMGYGRDADPALPQLQRTGEMVEAFMSDYYRHARVILRARDRILGRARRRTDPSVEVALRPLGGGLVERDGRIGLDELSQLSERPVLALRVYAEAVTRDMTVLSRTRDAISCATSSAAFCRALRDDPEAATTFTKLVCTIKEVQFSSGSVLSELHEVGLLLAMIPEFAPVVGRVHHDMYHVYTVDVHSIAAVDRLRELARGDRASELPLASRLAAEATRPRVLFLATLLHDVGKAIGGRGHAQRGAEMARTILERLALDPEEIDDACHLVLHHLTMYMMAVRRDLADPKTVEEFSAEVRGREGLRDLYLLTVVDVSTTSPAALTRWKRHMLDGLFRGTDAFLAGAGPARQDRVAKVREMARALWVDEITQSEFEQYLATMPARYFLSNSPHDVVAHAQLAVRRNADSIGFSLVPSGHEGSLGLCVVAEGQDETGVCVVAGDRPGLLASMAAAISANRFEIQAAQINTRALTSGGYQAVDVFWVRGTQDDGSEERLTEVWNDLVRILKGGVDPKTLVEPTRRPSWSGRRTPPVLTEVVFDHHASQNYTVIEVLAENRLGLLFTLASALHALNVSIGVAKISTEGKRAVDVFYAAEADGSKIQPGARTEEVRQALFAAVAEDNPDALLPESVPPSSL